MLVRCKILNCNLCLWWKKSILIWFCEFLHPKWQTTRGKAWSKLLPLLPMKKKNYHQKNHKDGTVKAEGISGVLFPLLSLMVAWRARDSTWPSHETQIVSERIFNFRAWGRETRAAKRVPLRSIKFQVQRISEPIWVKVIYDAEETKLKSFKAKVKTEVRSRKRRRGNRYKQMI